MDLCGWTSDPENSQVVYLAPQYNPQNYGGHMNNAQMYPLYNGPKISVRNDHNSNIPTTRFFYPQQTPNLSLSNFSQPQLPNVQRYQSKDLIVSRFMPLIMNQHSRRNRLINNPSDSSRIQQQNLHTSSHSMEPRMYSAFPSKTSRTQQSTLKSTQYFYNQNRLQQSYADLLKQNIQLKRLIDQQYKPLKKMYQKLKQQNQNRQFLVSQLEWKVKQLAKQMKMRKN